MKKLFCIAVVVAGLLALIGVGAAQAADGYKSFGVRMRAVYVAPNESFDSRLTALDPQVGDNVVPEVDLEYFITRNFSTELIAAVTRHDIKLAGNIEGSTWLLPPTLTVKYHPFAGSTVSPYVGVGLNVTLPFSANLNGVHDFKIDSSIGWAVQAGFDVPITENLYFNFDYKYVNISTKATIGGVKYDLDLNPNLVGIGVGYRF
jgi:outer membrane protein